MQLDYHRFKLMIGKEKAQNLKQLFLCLFNIRTSPEDILRYFAPMKLKVATLYENLHTATCLGNIRDVLKIEEKLKLLG